MVRIRNRNPHTALVFSIIKYLKYCGYAAGKMKTQGFPNRQGRYVRDRYLFRGVPDILAFTPRIVFIEVKTGAGQLTEYQRQFRAFCVASGAGYIEARCLNDVVAWVKGVGK